MAWHPLEISLLWLGESCDRDLKALSIRKYCHNDSEVSIRKKNKYWELKMVTNLMGGGDGQISVKTNN